MRFQRVSVAAVGITLAFDLPSVGPARFARGDAETMLVAARAKMDWENFMMMGI